MVLWSNVHLPPGWRLNVEAHSDGSMCTGFGDGHHVGGDIPDSGDPWKFWTAILIGLGVLLAGLFLVRVVVPDLVHTVRDHIKVAPQRAVLAKTTGTCEWQQSSRLEGWHACTEPIAFHQGVPVTLRYTLRGVSGAAWGRLRSQGCRGWFVYSEAEEDARDSVEGAGTPDERVEFVHDYVDFGVPYQRWMTYELYLSVRCGGIDARVYKFQLT
jgi:hypothetical protein